MSSTTILPQYFSDHSAGDKHKYVGIDVSVIVCVHPIILIHVLIGLAMEERRVVNTRSTL